MRKAVIFLSFIILIISCQNKNNINDRRIYILDNKDSINSQIKKFENSLLPAISVSGINEVQYSLSKRMELYKVPGISVAVINDYNVEWAKSYGVSMINTTDSILISTMFQAASLSKPITATVAMKYLEKGKLKLDEPVNSQLTKWQIPENEYTIDIDITPRMLLLHTSGLNVPGFPGYKVTDSIPSIIEILDGKSPANTEAIVPKFIPNTNWSYSGGGYIVLQLLLEEISNISFEELMQKNLFEPLGLVNSTFEQPLPKGKEQNAAKGHYVDNSVVDGNWLIYPEKAAAGLWTTPYDLANILVDLQKSVNLDSSKLLRKETLIDMLTKHWGSMGLGYLIRNEGDNTAFTFNGGNMGYRCDFFAYLNKGKGAVIMCNSDNGQNLINEMYRSIAKIYKWSDYNQEIIEPKIIDKNDLLNLEAEYITYWPNGEEYKFGLEYSNDKLHFIRNDHKYELVSINEKKFKLIDNGWTLDFSSNKGIKMDTIQCFLEFGNTIAIRDN